VVRKRSVKRHTGPIRTARQYRAATPRSRVVHARRLEAQKYMRQGRSFTAAAREAHIDPRTLRKYGGSDFRKIDGRYRIVRDRAYREIEVISSGRRMIAAGLSRRDASIASRYYHALKRYLRDGDESELRKIPPGTTVGGIELETDLDAIDELAARGELDDLEFYPLAA